MVHHRAALDVLQIILASGRKPRLTGFLFAHMRFGTIQNGWVLQEGVHQTEKKKQNKRKDGRDLSQNPPPSQTEGGEASSLVRWGRGSGLGGRGGVGLRGENSFIFRGRNLAV